MSTILKNILTFANLPVGVPVSQPHLLNVFTSIAVPVIPQLVAADAPGFTITADTVNVTVTRTATGGSSVRIYVEHWHTIESALPLPGNLSSLVPFVISSGGGGGAPDADLLKFTVHVAKNGNDAGADGSVEKPFLTVQAAMQYAWTTYVQPLGPQPVAPFTRPCVFVNAGTYDDGDLVLPPQICVMGQGYNHSRIKGNWSIDARWTNYPPPGDLVPDDMRSSWINVGLFGDVNINFDTVQSNEGKLYAFGVRFGGAVTLTEKTANPVSNQLIFTSVEFLGDVTLNGIPAIFQSVITLGGTLTLNQASGTGVDNIFQSSGGSIGNIVINAGDEGAPSYNCTFTHFQQPDTTLTLNGAYGLIKAGLDSVPLQSNIVFAGANINQIKRLNQLNWSGASMDRPIGPYVGQQYFDTTIARPIWWNGANWINAAGAVV